MYTYIMWTIKQFPSIQQLIWNSTGGHPLEFEYIIFTENKHLTDLSLKISPYMI